MNEEIKVGDSVRFINSPQMFIGGGRETCIVKKIWSVSTTGEIFCKITTKGGQPLGQVNINELEKI